MNEQLDVVELLEKMGFDSQVNYAGPESETGWIHKATGIQLCNTPETVEALLLGLVNAGWRAAAYAIPRNTFNNRVQSEALGFIFAVGIECEAVKKG